MNTPKVSIVIPARNEARHIAEAVYAFDRQTYPKDALEVLIVDALSEDGTRDAVIALQPARPWLKLLSNPQRVTPAGFNVGIRHASGDIVIIVGAHSDVQPEFVANNVRAMQTSGADCVGGRWQLLGETPVEQAIAAAMASPFGVGVARYRHSQTPGYTDTVPYAAYRREALLALGGFDERLVRNQDYELNWRLRAAGGTVYYDPAIVSTYRVKRGWRGLWRQYYQYGYWKARVIKMHPLSARWRHYVAPALVLVLAGSGLLSLASRWARALLALAAGSYALATTGAAAHTAAQHGWRHFGRLPLVFMVLHLSWGAGFWRGLLLPRLEPLPLPQQSGEQNG